MHEIQLDHTTDTGHRIVGHRGKCSRLHGHTYRWQIMARSDILNELGFVCDFGDIKAILDEWDHRLLLWGEDPLALSPSAATVVTVASPLDEEQIARMKEVWEQSHGHPVVLLRGTTFTQVTPEDMGVVRLPFNPTAENMAAHVTKQIIERVPNLTYASVRVWETPKCSAFYESLA